ncbi:MAG TPA: Hpt domain-containing protein [Terracidiphilus sp.]
MSLNECGEPVMKSIALFEQFVDLPELLGRIENDEELLVELFTLFLDDFPRKRTELQAAIESGNLDEIERTAHAIKGVLANLSAQRAASLAAEIESVARDGKLPKIQKAVAAFNLEATGFYSAVDAFMSGADK